MPIPPGLGCGSVNVLFEQVVNYNNLPMVRSDAMKLAKALEQSVDAIIRCIDLPEEPAGTVPLPYAHAFEQLTPVQPVLDLGVCNPANEH